MHRREVDDDMFLAELACKLVVLVTLPSHALRCSDDGLRRDTFAAHIAYAPRIHLVLDPPIEVSRVNAVEELACLLQFLGCT